MKLSVIIPVYQEPVETVIRAVNSVKNQFGYTPEDVEIILSVDLPGRKLSIPGARVLTSEENGGPGVARQRALDACCGEYVTFLDADDIFYNALAYQLFLKDIYTRHDVDIAKFPILEQDAQGCFHQLAPDSTWCFSKIYRRAFLLKHGVRFRDGLRVHEDSWFVRLAELYEPRVLCHGDMVYLWAYNPESTVRRDGGNYWQSCFSQYLDVVYDLIREKEKLMYDVKDDKRYQLAYAYANISRMDEPYAQTCLHTLSRRIPSKEVQEALNGKEAFAADVRAVEGQPNLPDRLPRMTFEMFLYRIKEVQHAGTA